jgi:D-glycero-D-manno-heptose 1,7-bisphosphate phosphatase
MKPAVFMDRDGTINEQMGYINHISRFVMLKGVPDAIRLLNTHGFLSVVVSNQSGVARGYFPVELVHETNKYMEERLAGKHAFIDAVYFCPHHPKGTVARYSIDCNCRKPRPGLVERACRQFDIDMKRSFVIGDRSTDMELAHRCGLKGVLVKTGYGRGEMEYIIPHSPYKPIYIAEDLLDAVKWILQ